MSIQLADISVYDPSLGKANKGASSNGLTSDAFMQLLVAQLRFQDPMQGMDQQAFMQQLATMSSMQQQQSINTSLSSLVTQSQVTQAAALVGHKITGTLNGQQVTGQVTAVNSSAKGVTLDLDSGATSLPFANVDKIQ